MGELGAEIVASLSQESAQRFSLQPSVGSQAVEAPEVSDSLGYSRYVPFWVSKRPVNDTDPSQEKSRFFSKK